MSELGLFVNECDSIGMGLYYYNARWYDPQTGRFIIEDPVRANTNWYIYALNNPLRFTDPTGLREIEGTEINDNDVYDAWDTQTIVNEPETKREAEDLNNYVQYWSHYDEPDTIQTGFSFTAGCGPTITASKGEADSFEDDSIQTGKYTTSGAGLMFGFNLGFSVDITTSENEDRNTMNGPVQTFGWSLPVFPFVSIGRDISTSVDGSDFKPFETVSISFGLGSPEAHYFVTQTTLEDEDK